MGKGKEKRVMEDSHKNKFTVFLAVLFLLIFFIVCVLKPAKAVSYYERRPLAQKPILNYEVVMDGKWMTDFEKYTMDQFPMRDIFRTVKSFFAYNIMQNKDVNKIYIAKGNASKMEYPLSEDSIKYATSIFHNLYDRYLSDDNKVFFAIVPDKNYYLAQDNGYLFLNYERMIEYFQLNLSNMEFIDLADCLGADSFYNTDTHWRQEKLIDVASRIKTEMGLSDYKKNVTDYSMKLLDEPFYGVYYGQSALPLSPDQIFYLDSDFMRACTVYDYETSDYIEMYDMDKAHSKDPYEMFLSGPKSIIQINNPNNTMGNRLIVFRDSFGSSLVPLLVDAYSEIVVVDIRYIGTPVIGKFIDFSEADVLFLYSSLVLNNSTTLK